MDIIHSTHPHSLKIKKYYKIIKSPEKAKTINNAGTEHQDSKNCQKFKQKQTIITHKYT